ncbi:hypothetical protein MNEG_16718 [Monoraphidium neglectum]|uniref:Uncharacterized protein n=1 Tax=Monoraphidium neglectum TaxID=145388 RepID=A0A0D2LMH7_9CHLO|nr:hypothetical protein MNEG_16718 [Monoraphidium neglectum]KIY91246.1 hypothetical protein MNEG_16718 [Monoraphidium neglectum]|eukprot:XP_013890266.1 hypothetical protein MNEG_16718 [Monoraphidium neglectum]
MELAIICRRLNSAADPSKTGDLGTRLGRNDQEKMVAVTEALLRHYAHAAARQRGFAGIGKQPPGGHYHRLLQFGCGQLLSWLSDPRGGGVGGREGIGSAAPEGAVRVWEALPRGVVLEAAAEVAEGLLAPG